FSRPHSGVGGSSPIASLTVCAGASPRGWGGSRYRRPSRHASPVPPNGRCQPASAALRATLCSAGSPTLRADRFTAPDKRSPHPYSVPLQCLLSGLLAALVVINRIVTRARFHLA